MTKYVEQFLTHLAAIAAALTSIAESMKSGPTVTLETTTEDPPKVDSKPKGNKGGKSNKAKDTPEPPKEDPPAEEPAKTDPAPPAEGTATKDDLRKMGTALVEAGKRNEFIATLGKYGAKNISELGDHETDAVLASLEKLLGKKLSEIPD